MRLRAVDWAAAGVEEKRGRKIDGLLQDLASRKEKRAMKASQDLWLLLKPGSAEGRTARPFLQEIRGISVAAVQGEIDDLLRRVS